MGKGRKKTPTKIKELRGTLRKDRTIDNEMTVATVSEIPSPPDWLSDIGAEEWNKVCAELHNKKMLHHIDLRLLEAYCNAISLHIETEIMLRKKGRIQVFKDEEGNVKHAQAVPYQKIANDALDRALKIATQFGFTPSSRSGISTPTINIQNNNHNYFD
jgi:P27 family predicted phage terminase small subunit